MKTRSISKGAACLLMLTGMAGVPVFAAHVQAGPSAAAVPAPNATDKQRAAQADADRLLRLAEELKTSVEKSRKDELNVQVIRDAEEIEKLARSLRSRVR